MRILSVSETTDSLAHNDALAMAGVAVVSPRTPEETLQLLGERDVDAVTIGHSVAPEMRSALISAIREVRPDIPLVFVYTAPLSTPEPRADISVDVTEGPSAVVRALSYLLQSGPNQQ